MPEDTTPDHTGSATMDQNPNQPDTDPTDTNGESPADAEAAHQPPAVKPEVRHTPPTLDDAAAKAHREIFSQDKVFADLGLRSSVLKGATEAGFEKPTSIQASLIPAALTGRDVLGQAKTGTGKTAAFGLPLLHMCNKDAPFQALVLAPTRELAQQISEEINELGKFTPIRAITVYGGQAIHTQAKALAKGAQIVVGTPGRIMDMVQRGHLHFNNIRFAVLDEVDRMLDIGFREDIRRILEMTPPQRQTIFVSATISPDIEKLARKYMVDPEKIVVTAGSLTASLVTQFYLPVNPWDKKRLLVHLLTHEEPALTLIFCRLKRTVDELARLLNQKGIEAHAMHGDMPQGKRNSTMAKLRGGNLSVLIASDVASRGIDADGISHVINYDLPDDVELYVHRIGRTARAGRGGVAWSLVTPEQGELLTSIEMLINAEIPKLDYPDFQPSPPPHGVEAVKVRKQRDESASDEPVKSQRLATPEPPKVEEKVDATKFPGGIVPTKLPPKRMQGRVKGRGR